MAEHVAISLSATHPRSSQITRLDEYGSPVASPLDTLQQVLSWTPGRDELCVASVPLRSRSHSEVPKVLICHDMMGGYTNDKYVQGCSDVEDYYFYNWQQVDAFVYFSHHFITIPPPGWTNTAHRHGVLSMGTLITEWKEGAETCHQLLNGDHIAHFAQQLIAIAEYYKFDGWLVNIENGIHPRLIDGVHMLLSILTTGMHEARPGSKVIWYDSVTTSGELKWQNELNQLNNPFFEMCDGIFLNYGWSEAGLLSSRSVAGERCTDVYVGVDVFGRGVFGGGGFNSSAALEVILRANLSAAIFAPGWVFETQEKAHFFQNQDSFWSLLEPYCPKHGVAALPIVSSFGRGCGEKVYIDGKVEFVGPWNNHSAQDLQPTFTTNMIRNDFQSSVTVSSALVDTSTVYSGGASLKVIGTVRKGSKKPALVRLFKTDVTILCPLLVCYTFKQEEGLDIVNHYVQVRVRNESLRLLLLKPQMHVKDAVDSQVIEGYGMPASCEMPNLPGCTLDHKVFSSLSELHTGSLHKSFTGHSEQLEGWKSRYFFLSCEDMIGHKLEGIDIALYSAKDQATSDHSQMFTTYIGELKVVTPQNSVPHQPSIGSLSYRDVELSKDHLSLTLTWKLQGVDGDLVDHCNIYSTCIFGSPGKEDTWESSRVFIGRAYTDCFRVANLYVISGDLLQNPFSVMFHVQPVTSSHKKLLPEDCPSLLFQLFP